ncbi:MAG: hypothetical protein ACI4UE_06890 [Candidatus Scatovivens sp.]
MLIGKKIANIYFEAETDRRSVGFNVLGKDESGELVEKDFTYQKVIYNNENILLNDAEEGERTKVIKMALGKEELNGLRVSINENQYQLAFEYIKHDDIDGTDENIYIPADGTSYYIGKLTNENGNAKELKLKVDDKDDKVYKNYNNIIKDGTTISEKTTFLEYEIDETDEESGITIEKSKYGTIEGKGNYIYIGGTEASSYKNSGENPIMYLVQEKNDVNNENIKTMYLDDYNLKYYVPIKNVKVKNKFLPLNISESERNNTLIEYNYENADIDSSKTEIKIIENLSNNPFYLYDVKNDEVYMKGQEINNSEVYIASNASSIENFSENTIGKIKVGVKVKDRGGNEKYGEGYINVGNGNFYIFVAENSTNDENPNKFERNLDDAINYANTLKNNTGKDPTIQQFIDEYTQDTDITIETNNLTYDMNGNTLTFANDKHLTINEGITFNLISSNDNKPNDRGCYTYNGNISFNHDTTFKNETVIKYISNEDFLSKYPQFKNVGTYLESGGIPGKTNTLWNRIRYAGLFTTRKIAAYTEYIHSFNAIGFNVNYSQNISGLINYGTLNFKSGKIVVNTYERVMAIGAFGGGAVLNISNTFLDILRALGIEVADLTDLTGSYSQLENTATGIENYGIVNLGEGSGIQNGDSESANHPEIEINVISKEHAYGVSVGNIRHPNKVISRAYGVWNKTDNSKTTMNSGFMTSFLTNNTNSWWSAVSVGKAYGIYNEKGKATINGITKKTVNRGSISIYNIIVDKIFRDYEDENSNVLQKNLEEIDKWWEKTVEQKTFYGFFTHSNLQLVSKLTGATYYTNSYAVGYPENGSSTDITMNQDIVNNVNDATKGNSDGYKGYSNNTYQSVQNFVNYYLNFKTINGNAFSDAYEKINNVLNTDWVGEDFNANNILDGAIKKIFNLIK